MSGVYRLNRTSNSVGRINTRRVDTAVNQWWLSGGIAAANCIAAYQAKGAASYAASLVNLANPGTYNATEGTAPDWAAGTGWTFNGTTQFLISSVKVGSGYSFAIRYSIPTRVAVDIFGVSNGSSRSFSYAPEVNVGPNNYWNLGGFAFWAGSANAGVSIGTNQKGYFEGTLRVSGIAAWSGLLTTIDMHIGGRNATTPTKRACTIMALAVYDTSIESYVSDLTTAMNLL